MFYKSLYDEDGNERNDRVVVFLTIDEASGNILSSTTGGKVMGVSATGLTFVVDKIVAEQIDKFKVVNYSLELKDGESIDQPQKSESELQEEELLRQLAELRLIREQDVKNEERYENGEMRSWVDG